MGLRAEVHIEEFFVKGIAVYEVTIAREFTLKDFTLCSHNYTLMADHLVLA
jgi:hypothetical protein